MPETIFVYTYGQKSVSSQRIFILFIITTRHSLSSSAAQYCKLKSKEQVLMLYLLKMIGT